MTIASTLAPGPPRGLAREIRRWDIVAVVINAIIGAGIFGLPSKVHALIGPYSLFAFAACAVVVTLIILCFAEVASRFRETGGPYLYAREAFGAVAGFEVGWLMWLARLTAFAANANLLVEYLAFFWPAVSAPVPRVAILTGITLVLTAANLVGVRDAARLGNLFTVGKLVPMALFVGAGLFALEPKLLELGSLPAVPAFSHSVLLLVYAFTGFEMGMIPSGEVRDPQRNLPFALLTGIGVVASVYIGIQLVCIGTLPSLASSQRPLVDAAGRFLGAWGAALITAGAMISITGNLGVSLLAGSRIPFAMAERRELPAFLAATHARFRTPHRAVLLTAALMLALTLSGTFIYALTISTLARLVTYGATCAALPLLRRRAGPAPFRAPAGYALSAASLALIIWLLGHATRIEARDTVIAGVAGLLIHVAYRMVRGIPSRPP